MHELLLFGQVLPSRHDQVLEILAGVTGMQPQRVVERHLIFKPNRSPGQSWAQVGGSQGVQNTQLQALQGQLHNELYYLQLVCEVSDNIIGSSLPVMVEVAESQGSSGSESHDGTRTIEDPMNGNRDKQAGPAWTLQFRDLPEVAGRRPVTSRMMSSVDIVDGDAFAFMDSLGYSYVSEYIIEGYRFIHQNVILLLHRVVRMSGSGLDQRSPRKDLPKSGILEPLDPSGARVLQSSVRIQDGSKPDSISVGINELKVFKEMMRGVVELDIGDRLALDPRLK